MLKWTTSLVLLLFFVGGCGEKDDPVQDQDSGLGDDGSGNDGNGGADEAAITYTGHIKAILDSSCTRCHSTEVQGAGRNGAPAGVNFNTYPVARDYSQRGNTRIQAGTMPPGGGIDQGERELFQKWLDQGVQE